MPDGKVSRFDKLLDAILMFMTHMTQKDTTTPPLSMTEEQMTRAMLEALKQGKSFMRPRTFTGGGGN